MRSIIEILFITLIIFCAMSVERYKAERDITKQLINNGETKFIFKDDIIVDNVRFKNINK